MYSAIWRWCVSRGHLIHLVHLAFHYPVQAQESKPLDLHHRRLGCLIGVLNNISVHEFDTDIDPLSEQNPLIFAVGPLTGTSAFNSNRFEVVSKSPLTGIYLDSFFGGRFGPEIKFAGYDGIIITGRAEISSGCGRMFSLIKSIKSSSFSIP